MPSEQNRRTLPSPVALWPQSCKDEVDTGDAIDQRKRPREKWTCPTTPAAVVKHVRSMSEYYPNHRKSDGAVTNSHLQGFQTEPARISHVRRFRAGTLIDKSPCLISLQRVFIRRFEGLKSAIRRRLACKDFRPAKTCKREVGV